MYYNLISSPIDDLLLVSDGEHLTGVFMVDHKRGPEIQDGWVERAELPILKEAHRQLDAYFIGELQTFDLPLKMDGTTFQKMVWEGLKAIPYGETISYGTFARRLGVPNASRAVGLANGRNPVSIIVPCHRVIGANGKLVGYGGGLARKQILLDLEARATGTTSLF